ncbi:FAD-dependent monooxygenase [Micromonospora sp. 4G57]|uniref:FAD-dependent monooxygenase n=1 Tax=Micromonospora sicca TaxID=2202420 RepID=A0ABU5J5W9_9ACTN|nr:MULTISPECIES: FAD-dependent monooxygenase [unclassified Micromonospora]MDZ5443526.1 FAD-dependent monooxygenase [Micromonospora sp. 4G57]MDZ5487974.1 FAD-dependent monooxygenase [Micromonospora sp. 4G53]
MTASVDVLIVGAGPTGLALAAQLAAHGVRPRLVDRSLDRVHESRALAIQPRTLEVLARFGVTDQLVAEGNPAVRLHLHARNRVLTVPMFDLGLPDTAYPHLLFLSQAETERILADHLRTSGVRVERGVELVDLRSAADQVTCRLRHRDGREETVAARYVVGCDGAHSAVRRAADIAFEGSSYPQTFVLADVEADGLATGAAHVFLSDAGMLFFFPLGRPAGWRLLVMRPPADPTPPDAAVTLEQVQALADGYTGGTVRLHDPVWMTNFRLHHRAARRYRAGRILLAGDAAHIHSPAGAQGMNTGIQDAINLGWKLAHTLPGGAGAGLLDTYEPERAPIGRMVLRFTDRAFTVATSTKPLVRFARTRIAPTVIPLAARARAGRAFVFRTVAELDIRYRRSPLSVEGPRPPRRGPRAGDRLPDAPVVGDRQPTSLHRATAAPGWHLLLCGPGRTWPAGPVEQLSRGRGGLLTVQRLGAHDEPGALHDAEGHALRRLGLDAAAAALYLVRPDGHVGFRSGADGWPALVDYLDRWLPPS